MDSRGGTPIARWSEFGRRTGSCDRAAGAIAVFVILLLCACSGTNGTPRLSDGPRSSASAAPADTPRAIQWPNGATENGFTRDSGQAYAAARGYGWQTIGGAPLDMTWSARSRTTGTALTKTFIDAFRHGTGVAWRLALPNGTYSVTIGVGDATYTDSVDTVSANGTSLVSAFKPSAVQRYATGTANVEVTNGALLLSTLGGYHTKINYLTIGSSRPVHTSSVPPVNLAWMYSTPARASDVDAVARRFSTFILGSTQTEILSNVRAVNPSAQLLQYFLFDQIIKPPAGKPEYHNNAAYLPGDFTRIWDDHPDWFLRDSAGQPVVNKGTYYRMDPANAQWRAFWLARVRTASAGWDGVFGDNADVSECGLDREHLRIPKYPNDATYTDALVGFERYAYEHYFAASGKTFMLNLTSNCTGRDFSAKYRGYSTGIFREGWGVDWHTGYLSPQNWDSQLTEVEQESAAGGSSVLVSQGAQDDLARQRFAFCSYLLVESPKVAFRYTQYLHNSYDYPWFYPDYDTDLGTATGPRHLINDGFWRRSFTKGYVLVNPRTHVASIHLNT